jgi:hypothetical protein
MIVPLNRPEAIKFLLRRRFPQLRPDTTIAAGGSLQFKFGAYDVDVAAQAEQYLTELRNMPVEKLQALHASEQAKLQQEFIEQAELEEKRRFYNQPGANADFDHWSRMADWRLDEAVALSMGKEPSVVNPKSLEPFVRVSAFAERYFKLRELAQRAARWEKLFDPVLPGIYIAWAEQNEIEFSAELKRLVVARGNTIGNWRSAHDRLKSNFDKLKDEYTKLQSQNDELLKINSENIEKMTSAFNEVIGQRDAAYGRLKELADQNTETVASPRVETLPQEEQEEGETSVREQNNMRRLIIAMAHAKYHFHPSRSKNSAASNIVTALNNLELKMSEGTVLTHLRKAAALVDWEAIEAKKNS